MTKEKKKFQHAASKHICQIYELLQESNLVSFPLTKEAKHKIESLAENISGVYFDTEIYATHEEKAIAYLYFIIKDHPFTDGNKRTATLTFEVVCDVNGLRPDYSVVPLDVLAVYIEKIQERDHRRVIRLLSDLLFK